MKNLNGMTLLAIFLFALPALAQIPPGGGTDDLPPHDPPPVTPVTPDGPTTPQEQDSEKEKKELKKLEKQLSSVMNSASRRWKQCYGRKLAADNLVELHNFMIVSGNITPPTSHKHRRHSDENAPTCRPGAEDAKEYLFDCFFHSAKFKKKLKEALEHPLLARHLALKYNLDAREVNQMKAHFVPFLLEHED